MASGVDTCMHGTYAYTCMQINTHKQHTDFLDQGNLEIQQFLYSWLVGLSDCVNISITIIFIETSRFSIISRLLSNQKMTV